MKFHFITIQLKTFHDFHLLHKVEVNGHLLLILISFTSLLHTHEYATKMNKLLAKIDKLTEQLPQKN